MKIRKTNCTDNSCKPQNNKLIKDTAKKKVARVRILMLLIGVILLFYFFHTLAEFRKGQALKDNIYKLYSELKSFKKDPDFIMFGFSPDYKYNKWKSQVHNLIRNPIYKKLLNEKIIPDISLFELGLSYYASEGNETELTKSTSLKYDKLKDSQK